MFIYTFQTKYGVKKLVKPDKATLVPPPGERKRGHVSGKADVRHQICGAGFQPSVMLYAIFPAPNGS